MRELLAALAHDQWSGWMKHLFSKCQINQDGTATIPTWAVNRWQRQMNTDYAGLPEVEKESDRKEADRYLAIMKDSYVLVTRHGTEIHLDPGPEGIRKKLDEVLAGEISQ